MALISLKRGMWPWGQGHSVMGREGRQRPARRLLTVTLRTELDYGHGVGEQMISETCFGKRIVRT